MPSRRLPNSMPAVIRTLTKARDTYALTAVPADRAISAAQFAQLDDASPATLLSRLLKEAHDVDLAQAVQSPLTTQVARDAAQLTMFVSHFHQAYDRGVDRGTFTAAGRAYYGREVTATTIPDLSTYDLVQAAAEAIIRGEADRQTHESGLYVAMAHPSAGEIQLLHSNFVTERNLFQTAETYTATQRDEAQAFYPEAQTLAVDICDTVEFFYRHDPDASSRRVKCERWGLVYVFEATPPPPAPPVPPVPPTP